MRNPSERRSPDATTVTRAARELLIALGGDLESEGLRDTPRRMADAYVIVRDTPFRSLCMHHVLRFYGIAHVAYLPADRILGISKLARVVDLFARGLQPQERLTVQIAGLLGRELQPRGVGVVIEAASVYVAARSAEARRQDHHLGSSRTRPR